MVNLSNNLSYILCKKFPVSNAIALRFLANLSNNLSYTLYRKFPNMFCAAFFG